MEKHLLKFKGDGKVRGLDKGSFRQGEAWQGVRMQLPVGALKGQGVCLWGRKHKKHSFTRQQG